MPLPPDRLRHLVPIGCAGILVACLLPSLARADTCAEAKVYASGEAASYEWLARIKAHANWRAKVRSIPTLGDPYAN